MSERKNKRLTFDGKRVVTESWQLTFSQMLEMKVKLQVHLTLEQHGFELNGSTYMRIFPPVNTIGPAICRFHICRFNQPWIENSFSTFPTVVSQLQIESAVFSWDPRFVKLGMPSAHCRVKS